MNMTIDPQLKEVKKRILELQKQNVAKETKRGVCWSIGADDNSNQPPPEFDHDFSTPCKAKTIDRQAPSKRVPFSKSPPKKDQKLKSEEESAKSHANDGKLMIKTADGLSPVIYSTKGISKEKLYRSNAIKSKSEHQNSQVKSIF